MIPIFKAQRLLRRDWVKGGTLLQLNPSNEKERMAYMPSIDEKAITTGHDAKTGDILWMKDIRFYEVDPDTLSLCSGVPDSAGTVIWEGDIVSILNTYRGPDAEKEYYVVRWNNEAAALVYTDNYGIMYTSLNGWNDHCIIKVEGNAWDNPELLEKIQSRTPEEFQQQIEKIARMLKEREANHES